MKSRHHVKKQTTNNTIVFKFFSDVMFKPCSSFKWMLYIKIFGLNLFDYRTYSYMIFYNIYNMCVISLKMKKRTTLVPKLAK